MALILPCMALILYLGLYSKISQSPYQKCETENMFLLPHYGNVSCAAKCHCWWFYLHAYLHCMRCNQCPCHPLYADNCHTVEIQEDLPRSFHFTGSILECITWTVWIITDDNLPNRHDFWFSNWSKWTVIPVLFH